MIFLHVEQNSNNIDELNELMKDPSKHLFLLIHMTTCGPCRATLPEWKKMENVLGSKYKDKSNVIIADVNQELLDKLKFLKKEPVGFPTMWYLKDNGKFLEEYEDSIITNKDRTIDSFVDWVESKITQKGGRKSLKRKLKYKRKTRKQKAGKWSLKYKKSINCKKPKGFSQRQYCKYGRKK